VNRSRMLAGLIMAFGMVSCTRPEKALVIDIDTSSIIPQTVERPDPGGSLLSVEPIQLATALLEFVSTSTPNPSNIWNGIIDGSLLNKPKPDGKFTRLFHGAGKCEKVQYYQTPLFHRFCPVGKRFRGYAFGITGLVKSVQNDQENNDERHRENTAYVTLADLNSLASRFGIVVENAMGVQTDLPYTIPLPPNDFRLIQTSDGFVLMQSRSNQNPTMTYVYIVYYKVEK
jgi:hypothetical protein